MALPTSSPRRPSARLAIVAAVALLGMLGAAGCSSSKNEGASATATTAVSSPTGSSAAGSGSSSTTAGKGEGPLPTSPSTLPTYDSTCAALAETYGLNEIQPKNTSSWVDERQRVVVDAQREAGLLGEAQKGAPADLAPKLAMMQGYATWLAGMVDGATSYASAITQRDAYPGLVDVSLAVASVQTWQKGNCAR